MVQSMTGYYQIKGTKDVTRPEGVPLKMPRVKYNQKQRQVILDWFYGKDPTDYS